MAKGLKTLRGWVGNQVSRSAVRLVGAVYFSDIPKLVEEVERLTIENKTLNLLLQCDNCVLTPNASITSEGVRTLVCCPPRPIVAEEIIEPKVSKAKEKTKSKPLPKSELRVLGKGLKYRELVQKHGIKGASKIWREKNAKK